jgi:hypothetical protein
MADRHETEHRSFRMDDGTGPGDITSLPSGHDACVVGGRARRGRRLVRREEVGKGS